jgi:hypothetical protein
MRWRKEISQLFLELEPPILQPVAQRYTTELSLLIEYEVQIVILANRFVLVS